MPTAEVKESADTLAKTAMVAGEVFIPGASDVVAGNIASGIGHFVAAGLAAAVLLPASPLLAAAAAIGIRANSYLHATTGNNIWTKTANQVANRTRSAGAE